jgi:hypothetical protein
MARQALIGERRAPVPRAPRSPCGNIVGLGAAGLLRARAAKSHRSHAGSVLLGQTKRSSATHSFTPADEGACPIPKRPHLVVRHPDLSRAGMMGSGPRDPGFVPQYECPDRTQVACRPEIATTREGMRGAGDSVIRVCVFSSKRESRLSIARGVQKGVGSDHRGHFAR